MSDVVRLSTLTCGGHTTPLIGVDTLYIHGTVNHSRNFVDPVHTNSIEGTSIHAKKLKPRHK